MHPRRREALRGLEIHGASGEDVAFLRRALALAVWWNRADARLDVDRALDEPELRYLLDGWGREGDLGLVARLEARPVGAAWLRLWTRERHSHGFVDEATPELAVAVEPGVRGQGLGTELLHRLLSVAEGTGTRQVSLSVAFENPAARLYQRLGFRRCGTSGDAWTMVLELGARPGE